MTTCFRDALIDAGVSIPGNMQIPSPIKWEEAVKTCKILGLQIYYIETVTVYDEPMIVMYKTKPGKGHAVFTDNIKPFIDRGVEFIGIILFRGD